MAGAVDVIELTPDDWVPHPSGDDVTVAYLRAADLRDFKYETVPVERFVTEDDAFPDDPRRRLYHPGVYIGAYCFMVGRFITDIGEQQNMPAARFGTLSMIP